MPQAFDSAVSRWHTLYNFTMFPAEWQPQSLTWVDTESSRKVHLQIISTKVKWETLKNHLNGKQWQKYQIKVFVRIACYALSSYCFFSFRNAQQNKFSLWNNMFSGNHMVTRLRSKIKSWGDKVVAFKCLQAAHLEMSTAKNIHWGGQ